MNDLKKCTSCNIDITNQEGVVNFKCPKCGEQEIIRCPSCRVIAIKYTCKKCNFEGP